MPPKRKGAKRKSQRGKGPRELLTKAIQLAKDTQIVSKGLAMSGNPILQGIGEAAGQLGYGRQHGGSIFDGLGNLAAGLGQGIGSAAYGVGGGLHSLFGGGRGRQRGGMQIHAMHGPFVPIR